MNRSSHRACLIVLLAGQALFPPMASSSIALPKTSVDSALRPISCEKRWQITENHMLEVPVTNNEKVWVNPSKKTYYCEGDKSYGKTKRGFFMLEPDALKKGFRSTRILPCRRW